DLFFGEVRPFEEVFRESQGGGGGEGESGEQAGGGNSTAKLTELQKQIMNSTWKLKRSRGDRSGRGGEPAKPTTGSSSFSSPARDVSEQLVHELHTEARAMPSIAQGYWPVGQFFAQRVGADETATAPRRGGTNRLLRAQTSSPLLNQQRSTAVNYEEDLKIVHDVVEQAIDQARE